MATCWPAGREWRRAVVGKLERDGAQLVAHEQRGEREERAVRDGGIFCVVFLCSVFARAFKQESTGARRPVKGMCSFCTLAAVQEVRLRGVVSACRTTQL